MLFEHKHRYWFIIALSIYTFANTMICEVYRYFNITIPWPYALLTIFGVTLLTWEGNRFIDRPLRKRRLISAQLPIKKLILGLLLGMIFSTIAAAAMVILVGVVLHELTWPQLANPFKLNVIYGGLINLLFHLLHVINLLFEQYRTKWDEAEKLRSINSQAEIQLVKSQINPHFLFNNLNVLSAMVIKDNPGANKFIEEFAKVYRYILKNQGKDLVTLESDMEFIKPYLYLLKQRFGDGLQVLIDISPGNQQKLLIPAAIQMLLENAIKHNIVSAERPLQINIHVDDDGCLVIGNNLQHKTSPEPSTLIGLDNIKARYRLIANKSVKVNQTKDRFEVTLPLLTQPTIHETSYN